MSSRFRCSSRHGPGAKELLSDEVPGGHYAAWAPDSMGSTWLGLWGRRGFEDPSSSKVLSLDSQGLQDG